MNFFKKVAILQQVSVEVIVLEDLVPDLRTSTFLLLSFCSMYEW